MKSALLFLVFTLISSTAMAAGDYAGRLVRKAGELEIFLKPSKNVTGKGPHVKFEGMYYTVKKNPRLGYKIPNASVVRTGAKSKARIVYKNGDQFSIGEGTSYKIVSHVTKAGSKRATSVNLLYGKIRAVISNEGPRSNMKIRTNTAVMGIRGTDFYVSKRSSLKGAEVSVLRGMVELKGSNRKGKSVKIQTGFSGKAPPPTKKLARGAKRRKGIQIEAAVVVLLTSKQELVKIQNQSVIKKDEMSKEKVNSKVAAVLERLEKKAVDNTLKDIKRYDPEMYAKLKDQKLSNVDEINTNVVKKVFQKAPDRPTKANLDDLSDENVYEKYFTIE
jgi:hypothetical protein